MMASTVYETEISGGSARSTSGSQNVAVLLNQEHW